MTRRLAALAGTLVLALAGCGGDDAGNGDAGSNASAPDGVRTVTPAEGTPPPAEGQPSARPVPADFDAQEIFERDGPGVVTILAASADGGGEGSGFVISKTGEIATNAHVVSTGEGASIREAQQIFVQFASNDRVAAELVGLDPFSDVALLRVDPKEVDLQPLGFGDVGRLRVGQPVAAIGSPFGEERSLSVGVVSALDRDITSLTGFQTGGAIQTDAAINSGNSGGPLLDGAGNVIGITSQIRTKSGDGTGVGFAVPSDVVQDSLKQIRDTGKVEYPYLGVSTTDVYPQVAERFKLGTEDGAWVQQVVPGGPSAAAGLRAGSRQAAFQGGRVVPDGDVIVKLRGRDIARGSELGRALVGLRPGDTVEAEVLRAGKRQTVKIRLGRRPVEVPRG